MAAERAEARAVAVKEVAKAAVATEAARAGEAMVEAVRVEGTGAVARVVEATVAAMGEVAMEEGWAAEATEARLAEELRAAEMVVGVKGVDWEAVVMAGAVTVEEETEVGVAEARVEAATVAEAKAPALLGREGAVVTARVRAEVVRVVGARVAAKVEAARVGERAVAKTAAVMGVAGRVEVMEAAAMEAAARVVGATAVVLEAATTAAT